MGANPLFIIAVFVLFLVSGTSIEATVFHVPEDISTIQEAVNMVLNGDTVLVSPGTYVENINFVGKGILLISEWGADSTEILPATHTLPVVRFVTGEDSNSIIDGFSIGNITGSPGIQCSYSGPIIRNCEISYCIATGAPGDAGRGISCLECFARIRDNRIHHNTAKIDGGGIDLVNPVDVEVRHNDIYNNGSYFLNTAGVVTGVKVFDPLGPVVIERNLIRGNFGAAVEVSGGNIDLINNTIVYNQNGIIHGGTCGTCEFTVLNNIVAFNRVGAFYISVEYTAVWPDFCSVIDFPGPNGVLADPLFIDPSSGNYSLDSLSPCIDAGHPDPIYNDPDGTRNDIGAGPFVGPPHDPIEPCQSLQTGDVNYNGTVSSSDLIYLVNYIFKSGCGPAMCEAVGDVNCSGSVTSADLVNLVNYIFMRAVVCDVCTLIPSVWSCP